MDEIEEKQIIKLVKDYALDSIPEGATDEEIFNLLQNLSKVFKNAAKHVLETLWWNF